MNKSTKKKRLRGLMDELVEFRSRRHWQSHLPICPYNRWRIRQRRPTTPDGERGPGLHCEIEVPGWPSEDNIPGAGRRVKGRSRRKLNVVGRTDGIV